LSGGALMITSAMSPVSSTNALLTSDPFAVTDTFDGALVLIRASAGPRALPPAAATPQSRGSGVRIRGRRARRTQ